MIATRPTDARTEAEADLREFVRQAEASGELQRVVGADAESEIGVLFDLSNHLVYPPVLLFEDIPGYDRRFRILTNVRSAKLLVGEVSLEAVKAYRARPKDVRRDPIPPQVVADGPVLANVVTSDAIDLRRYPAPKWHPGDGGRYIGTECMIIMRDPETGWVNVGTYRTMVQDERTLSVFIDTGKHGDFIRRKYWARGEACPVAISIGQAPILGLVAATSTAMGEDEYALAGGRLGRPVEVVLGQATGLPIPADAELVFEGFMPPPDVEERDEGPFGEWPGYYASAARPEPVVHVERVYHRDDPLIIGAAPLTPVHASQFFKVRRIAALWDALEAAGVPGVKAVWKMPGSGARFIDVIAIEQLFPGHAKMAGLVSAGCREGGYMTRMVIVVDDDINVENPAEVMWALSTRWDPKTQTDIIDGCWTGHIDPVVSPEKRASGDITTSRMIVCAVRPYHWKEAFPKANTLPKSVTDPVRHKWADKLPFLAQLR